MHGHPIGNARILLQLTVEAGRDVNRLKRDLPTFRHVGRLLPGVANDLQASYLEYTSTVSSPGVAISSQLAGFLLVSCRLLRPARILDTGSGYSSYVLRRYAAETGGETHVTSVDDDAEWLAATRAFLASKELDDDDLLSWDDFSKKSATGYDLIVHDMGHMNTRARTLAQAMRLVRPSGILILDDVHFRDYGSYARRTLSASSFRTYSLRAYTLDRMDTASPGRYALLAAP